MNKHGMKYESYEEYAEEILAYMKSGKESFRFGPKSNEMTEEEIEDSKQVTKILRYIKELNEEDYKHYQKGLEKYIFNLRLKRMHDSWVAGKFGQQGKRLNCHKKNMVFKMKRMKTIKRKEFKGKGYSYPYYIKIDKNGKEYLAYDSKTFKRKAKDWAPNRRKTEKMKHNKYLCEHCGLNEEIINYQESLCKSCVNDVEQNTID